jgi:hypothetical protein
MWLVTGVSDLPGLDRYAQGKYNVTSALTHNLGVRYENSLAWPWTKVEDRMFQFDPTLSATRHFPSGNEWDLGCSSHPFRNSWQLWHGKDLICSRFGAWSDKESGCKSRGGLTRGSKSIRYTPEDLPYQLMVKADQG